MTTRRELLPLLAGSAGLVSARSAEAAAEASEPELRRVSFRSASTAAERDYFVYLPRGFTASRHWPVILFLHGDGERGDGKSDLDYVLCHGPLYEAWIQRRDLPFVMIAPQLPLGTQADDPFFKQRTRAVIPQRAPDPPPRPDENNSRIDQPLQRATDAGEFSEGADEDTDGWQSLEPELVAMIDHSVKHLRGDRRRVYVIGLSRGGFGAWHFAARHPDKVAALAPVVGYGHPDLAEPIARARLPLWQFAGGRDPAVPLKNFYALLNRLEALGHPDVRFTIHEDLGHFTWVRVYGGQDIYHWMLRQSQDKAA
jgi:predicted peptidase